MHFNPRSREGSDGNNDAEQHTVVQEFQSTLPRRERRQDRHGIAIEVKISIHAPAKGATFYWLPIIEHVNNFNPRSREGSDKCRCAESNLMPDFNPRSREGSDRTYVDNVKLTHISIHAPAKGATVF